MKKIAKKLGKWVVLFYVVQAVIGIAVGVYFGVTTTPEEIERMVSCVAN